MRWYIIRILLQKEFHRHLADRGSLALALLLVVAALLLSLFGKSGGEPTGLSLPDTGSRRRSGPSSRRVGRRPA